MEGTGPRRRGVEPGVVMMMSTRGQLQSDDDKSLWLLFGMLVLSVSAHLATFVMLPSSFDKVSVKRTVEMEIYVPPTPPPKEPEPPPEEPKPLEKVKVKPPPVKVAQKEPPKEDLPPPPNQVTPEAPKPVMIIPGIQLESTTGAGEFAVPVGNTTMGKADKVVDPSQVQAYSAPKYAPPGGADTEPVILGEVKIPYPEEAKKNEVEGSVRLKVTLDPGGQVTQVAVISGPGYGLNEAARDALKRFRFKPATKGGESVGYTFIYTYTFLLD